MPFDIELGGATSTRAFAFRQCQPLPASSRLGALVVVRSGVFSAAMPFFMERKALRAWHRAIVELEQGELAEATLTEQQGRSSVVIARKNAGDVTIRGALYDPEDDQQLSFRLCVAIDALALLRQGLQEALNDQ